MTAFSFNHFTLFMSITAFFILCYFAYPDILRFYTFNKYDVVKIKDIKMKITNKRKEYNRNILYITKLESIKYPYKKSSTNNYMIFKENKIGDTIIAQEIIYKHKEKDKFFTDICVTHDMDYRKLENYKSKTQQRNNDIDEIKLKPSYTTRERHSKICKFLMFTWAFTWFFLYSSSFLYLLIKDLLL